MDQKRKKAVTAAVMAAVMSYIKQEEVSVPQQVALAERTNGALYGASGRQQMMEMRRLLSLRMGRK